MTAVAGQNVEAVFRLTPTQEGILYHTLLSDEPGMYLQQFSCTLVGEVQLDLFRDAWRAVVGRYSALRSLVAWEGLDDPVQLVRREVDLPWHVEDLRGLGPQAATQHIERYSDRDLTTDFDLDVAPLMRFALLRMAPDRTRFFWTHHHVVLDGWSVNIVLRDVVETYHRLAEGQEATQGEEVPFQLFADHLAKRDRSEALTYWRQYLDGIDEANPLNASGREPQSAFTSGQLEKSLRVSQSKSDAIRAFAADNKLTLDTVFRAAWAIVVSRYSGSDEVVFGTTVSGRPPELDGSLEMVGLFINTLPVRVQLDPEFSVRTLFADVQADRLVASDHEWLPLPDIQSQADVAPGQPLFTSLFTLENQPGVMANGQIAVEEIQYRQWSNFGLALVAFPAEEFQYVLLHDPELFDGSVAASLIRQFAHVVDSAVGDPDQPVGNVALFPDEELDSIVSGFNRTQAEVSETDVVTQIVEHSVKSPDVRAVTGPAGSLTYQQLIDRVLRLASRLRAGGVRRGDMVAVAMERSPAMFVAILGTMMSGAAYVPVDPKTPPIRLRQLTEVVAVAAIVQDAETNSIWDETEVHRLDAVGNPAEGPLGEPAGKFDPPSPDDPAYVMFTSGSTGTPKGVVVTHANLAASNNARHTFYQSPASRFLLLSPFYFDSSVAGIFWALTTGGTLVLPGPGLEQDVSFLAESMEQHEVTHLLALPSVYELLLTTGSPQAFANLEMAIVAGEACPPRLVDLHDSVAPDARLFNEYGPTETTVWATAQLVSGMEPPRTGRVPIGRPIPNVEVYLLDHRHRPVPRGVAGELCIAGPTVSAGYLGDQTATDGSFVKVDLPGRGPTHLYRTGDLARYDSQGKLDLVGRVDRQLKVRGRRIEPGEIEAVISSHPSVGEAAAVLAQQTGNLAAYYTSSESNGGVDPVELTLYLSERLPDHLVPSHLTRLGTLPATANGKIDYVNLATMQVRTRSPVDDGARTEGERLLIRLSSDLLGHGDVAITDNFFDAGGHSLLSMQLISRVFKETGVQISPNSVLHNTLRYVARQINIDSDEAETPTTQRSLSDSTPLFIDGPRGSLFAMLHRPAEASGKPILIAPPYGWEYYKTHAALRRLGRYLADTGHPVLRPDYHGTGDSEGEPDDVSISGWIEDLRSAATFVTAEYPTNDLVVIGLRTGAAAALTWAASDERVSQLILWDPVVYGSTHMQELQSVQVELFAHKGRDNVRFKSPRELLGSVYSETLRSDLRSLDLTGVELPARLDVRAVVSSDASDYRELADASGGRIRLDVVEDAGHWTDTRTFHSAVVPARIPRHIVQLVDGSRG